MKRQTLLIVFLVLFLVLNLCTLGFVFLRDSGHQRPGKHTPPVDAIIIKTLGYDEAQVESFNTLKSAHHKQMMELDEGYAIALKAYFSINEDSSDKAKSDSLEQVFCRIQTEKARVTRSHFQDLKDLCRPEQKERFRELVPELVQIIVPKKNMPPPRRN
jgi:hypothetical protein